MSAGPAVTLESITRLCAVADLPVATERQPGLAGMFLELVTAANALSRTMADAKYRTVVPILRFP
jgi:hypothetical protein